jgi:Iap family predicted aminopeptidase
MDAIKNKNTAGAMLLLNLGSTVDKTNKEEQDALIIALDTLDLNIQDFELIQEIIKKTSFVKRKDNYGNTPLNIVKYKMRFKNTYNQEILIKIKELLEEKIKNHSPQQWIFDND